MTEGYVTVVIVSYKSAQLTIDSLRSVYQEKVAQQGLKTQVIVVDNASGDAPAIEAAVIEQNWSDWVTVLTAPRNGGFAYGNNYAFQYALAHGKVDYFHLLNPDAQVRPNAIMELVQFLKAHPDAGIAGSSFENQDGSLWPIAFRFPSLLSEFESGVQLGVLSKLLQKWVVPVEMEQKAQPIDWVAGASMMLTRALVEEIRGFDESYFLYFEETDLCLRAKRAGYATWYVPTSRVMHIAGQSTKVTERDAKPKRLPVYLFESRRRYFIQNHGLFYAITLDVLAFFANFLGEVKRFLQGKSDESVPNYLFDLLSHSTLWPSNWKSKPFTSQLPPLK